MDYIIKFVFWLSLLGSIAISGYMLYCAYKDWEWVRVAARAVRDYFDLSSNNDQK